jgi:hypothetical protein
MYPTLAISPSSFADMTTYYYHTLEEALKRVKATGKRPGCHFGGIVLKSGKKGFAIYQEGKVIEQYLVVGRGDMY